MRVGRLATIGVGLALAVAPAAKAQVPIEVTEANTTFKQNFNTLAPSGSNSATTLPPGVIFAEAGTGADTTYSANDGTVLNPNTYSFGLGTNLDRAFGEITGTLQSIVGFGFHNATGAPITGVLIGYSGEQWRLGSSAAPVDKLDAQYSLGGAAAINSGAFTDIDELDFSSPENAPGSVGALNGNSAANRTVFEPFWVPASVPPGALLWIRWIPVNAAGNNDGLAIDDVTITTLQADADHDGVPDAADNCPAAGNQDQANTDGDGQGNACDLDDDGDGAPDATDNCPAANADQSDIDADGQGDPCDLDDDGDGVVDASDQCPAQSGPVEDRGCPGIAHPPGLADTDGDGLVDGSDQCPAQDGPVENHGCPASSQPPDTSACDAAKAALAKAKAKLKKLRQKDASKRAIAKAKKKVKKAKAAVAAACAT
jgi:hypothetical protein